MKDVVLGAVVIPQRVIEHVIYVFVYLLAIMCLLDLFEDRELSVKNVIEQCYVRVWLDISEQIFVNPFLLSIPSLMIP